MLPKPSRTLIHVSTTCLAFLAADLRAAALPVTTVMRTGQQAPGLPAGVKMSTFVFTDVPIDNAGRVLFYATLSGPGITSANDQAVYFGSAGAIAPILREGDAAPGLSPDFKLSGLAGIALNRAGQSAMMWSARSSTDPTQFAALVYRVTNGLPEVAAVDHQPLSGNPALAYNGFVANYTFLTDAGQVAFLSDLTPSPGTHTSLVAGPPGAMHVVQYAAGNQIFGPQVGAGGLGFTAFIPSGTGSANAALLSSDGVTASPVAVVGQQAPALPPGTNYTSISAPSADAVGNVAFDATATGDSRSTLFYGPLVAPAPILRTGQQAPGLPAGATLTSFIPTTGANGGLAVYAGATPPGGGSSQTVVYAGQGNDLKLVAYTGMRPPGATGSQFLYMIMGAGSGGVGEMAVNGRGQIAFIGYVNDPANVFNGFKGAWATTPDGTLQLLAADGMPFSANGYTGTVYNVELLGNTQASGIGSGMNDAGQVALALSFTDGNSGIFLVTVPEPTALATIVAAALVLLPRRRNSPD